jgi:hypothetical protein
LRGLKRAPAGYYPFLQKKRQEMKDESLENNIVFLHALGWSVRRLSSEFKISRERVDRITKGQP